MEPEVRERFEFIEKTLAYVAESQKRAEARADRVDARMDRFDKRLDATRKFVETGMRMLVKLETSLHRLEISVEQLAESQRDTDRKLKLFLNSMTKGRNGRKR